MSLSCLSVAVDDAPPSRERMPDDWIGPFRPFASTITKHEQLLGDLLMIGDGIGKIIPFGKIHGVMYDGQGNNAVYKLDLVPVGQKNSEGALPKHAY